MAKKRAAGRGIGGEDARAGTGVNGTATIHLG